MRISDWSSDVCSSDLFSAIRRNSLADKLIAVLSVSFIAIPYFVISIYTLLIFAVMLQWFPATGVGEQGDIGSQLRHLVLPAFAVGISRSEEPTSELKSLMPTSYAVFCWKITTQTHHPMQLTISTS